MLKIILISLLAIFIIAVALAITGHKSVHAELAIDVPPEEVWAAITDAESYASWNPILIEANGDYIEGGAITYQMKIGDSAPSEVTPVIKHITTNEHLHQGGGMKGILTYDHEWILRPVDSGTLAIQHEEYTGIGVWFWDPSEVEKLYQSGLESLKAKLEGHDS